MIQLDRGRGLHRSEAEPLDTFVFNDLPMPQQIDQHDFWEDATSWMQTAAQRHGVVPDLLYRSGRGSNQLAAALLPDLFSRAADLAEHRRSGDTPEELQSRLQFANPFRIWLKLPGSRSKLVAIVDAESTTEAKAKLTAALGEGLTLPARLMGDGDYGPMEDPT